MHAFLSIIHMYQLFRAIINLLHILHCKKNGCKHQLKTTHMKTVFPTLLLHQQQTRKTNHQQGWGPSHAALPTLSLETLAFLQVYVR